MTKKISILMMLFLLIIGQQIYGQTGRISGTITEVNGNPIIGASVQIKGTNIGTITDVDGKYSLNVTENNATLAFSYIGYEKQELKVIKQVMNVVLVESAKSLDEIVVVAYGTQKKVNLTGAVSSVNMNEIENKPVANIIEALQGTSPGLIIQQSNSTPGTSPSINIRGLKTMNNNNPLVIVDGIVGNLEDVNPNDIENISVLKDASSTAIYGSRASNGIILVTTKKGDGNKQVVSYDAYYGWQSPTSLPQVVDSWTYAQMYDEAQVNSGKTPKYTDADIANFKSNGPNDKWLNDIYRPAAPQQAHNVSITGGNKTTTFLISAGYLNQESMFVGPDYGYKRYNARANISHQLSKNFKITSTASYTRKEATTPAKDVQQIVRQAERMPPFFTVKDSLGFWTTPSGSNSNAIARLYDGGYSKSYNDNVSGTLNGELKIIDGLKLSAMLGGELYDNQQHTNNKSIFYPVPGSGDTPNSIVEAFNRTQDLTGNVMLTFNKNFGKHSFMGLAGYSYEGENYRWFSTSRNLTKITYDVLGDPLTSIDVSNSGAGNDWSLYSWFGRLTYNFDERYLFEFNIRDDMSSKFNKDNRSAIFPSFSAGWRISEERFFKNIKEYVPNLKLRGSWGLVGNDRIGLYQYLANVSVNQSYVFGDALVNTSNFSSSNPDLKWETTAMTDIGGDIGLLKNNLNLSFDYFNNLTSDILVNLPVASVFGSSAPIQNASKVQTQGWELAISYKFKTGKVNHHFSFNISDSKNKVLDNKGRVNITSGTGNTIIKEGYPLFSYYGYKSDGFFQNQAEAAAGPHLPGVTPKPGDIRYVDQNKDSLITDDGDRVVLGDRFPHYTFGFNYGFDWKGFDFSMFWQGVGKRGVWLNGVATEAFANNFEGPVLDFHLNRWTPDNPNATYPRLTMGAESKNNEANSDFWIENAAYLRLKNIQLGYTLPKKITKKVLIQSMRVYTSIENALTFSKMRGGWDPEVSEGNGNIYAVSRVISVGVNIKL